ncbi:hypothetical protein ANCCAN_15354 [Ancylostoma caninum]|uniref:Uncharacterized protein n=1 Tax=Ancylostoma caninum TaxID=29170 RepID=A0A368G2Z0_ANCCA|nr:hypothetical protein ANCCAN_15354 [Ancylostoma caninum]
MFSTLRDSVDTALEISYSFKSVKNLERTQDDSESMVKRRPTQRPSDGDETFLDAPSLQRMETSFDTDVGSLRPALKLLFEKNKPPARSTSAESILGPEMGEATENLQKNLVEPDTCELVRRAEMLEPLQHLKNKEIDTTAKGATSKERSKEAVKNSVKPHPEEIGRVQTTAARSLKEMRRENENRRNTPFTIASFRPVTSEIAETLPGSQSSAATSVQSPTPWRLSWKKVLGIPRQQPTSSSDQRGGQNVTPKDSGSSEGSAPTVERGSKEVEVKEEPTMKSVSDV